MAPFRARLAVRFGDIDHAGIVYYPRFLHYFHVALEEFFGACVGVGYAEAINARRLGLPSVHLEIDFKRPLRFGDRIEVEVGVERIGTTSIAWRYTTYKEGEPEPVAVGRIVTVCLDMDGFRKRPVPDWLRAPLAAYQRATAGAAEPAG